MYHSVVVTVSDMAAARRFHETALGLRVRLGFGQNIAFPGGFSLHHRPHFARLSGIPEYSITPPPANLSFILRKRLSTAL